jgi:hypothetical protein
MQTVLITTTYNSSTREMKTVATMMGFVPSDPSIVSSATQLDSVTLTGGSVLSAADMQVISTSQSRATRTANADAAQWAAAAALGDKGGQLAAASVDPVAVFQSVIANPNDTGDVTVDSAKIFRDVIANPNDTGDVTVDSAAIFKANINPPT